MNKYFLYSPHDDLLKNYLFLSSVIINHIKHIHSEYGEFSNPEFNDYKITNSLEKNGALFISQQKLIKHNAIEEIKKIHSILKHRFNEHKISDDNLLISRLMYSNWKDLIKIFIQDELKQSPFKSIIKKIENRLIELKYRLNNIYTCNLDIIIKYGLYVKAPINHTKEEIDIIKSIFDSYETDFEIHGLSIDLIEIEDDIKWLSDLGEKEFKNNKLELAKGFSKKELENLIIHISKCKRYFNTDFNDNCKSEINKFIRYITTPFHTPNFNLDFIIPNTFRQKKFLRIFLYLEYYGLISSNKGDIEKIIADVFSRSGRTFHIPGSNIKKELSIANEKGIAFETKFFLQKHNYKI